MGEKLWTVSELADYLQLEEQSLRNWRYTGDGPRSFRVGKYIRYSDSDVQTWLAEQRDAG